MPQTMKPTQRVPLLPKFVLEDTTQIDPPPGSTINFVSGDESVAKIEVDGATGVVYARGQGLDPAIASKDVAIRLFALPPGGTKEFVVADTLTLAQEVVPPVAGIVGAAFAFGEPED